MPGTETVTPTIEQAYTSAKKEVEASVTATDETKSQTTPQTEQAEAAAPSQESASSESLLTPEQQKLTGDAKEKELNRAWTQKTQELAKQRKEVEQYLELINAIKQNPRQTIKQMAEELGLTVQELKQQVEEKAKEEPAMIDKQALGSDLEFLGDKLSPALKPLTDQVRSLSAELERIKAETAQREAATELEAFEKDHPDWKKYESKMAEIGRKLNPVGMDTHEYLGILYDLANKPAREVKETVQAIERIQKAAGAVESKESGVPPEKIAPAPSSRTPTIEEAFEAAKKGIRWE